jgi:uncharacterized protein
MKSSLQRTYRGRRFHHRNPRLRDICIEDIAHALSLVCRYAGHIEIMYSVAEHCVRISRLLDDPTEALWGLLHDGSEAYYGDIHRYLKRMPEMRGYRRLENRCMRAIAKKFKLKPYNRGKEPASVHLADRILAITEMRDLRRYKRYKDRRVDGVYIQPLSGIIKPWSSRRAEREFLKRFVQLQSALRRVRR